MAFNDLREFIAKCQQTGDVVRVDKEVDWNLEVGAIARRGCELLAPAPFFQKIKDYSEDYRILANTLATFRRLAIAMGLNPDAAYEELVDAYMQRSKSPIKPILVSKGPCKENIHVGNDVDLLEFPIPIIHGGDGGRYMCTWHLTITKDLDTDWVNWGMYRHMYVSKDTLVGLIPPIRHGSIILGKYEAHNRPQEVAFAIGTEPICSLLSTSSVPYGVSEVDIAGAIRMEPVPLIKCETVDLLVPASSEIVIEGERIPAETAMEGPFGEYGGYTAVVPASRPVVKVRAVTHRNNPILTMSCMGIPVDDWDVAGVLSLTALIQSFLLSAGVPIKGVYFPPEGCGSLCVVSTKIQAPGIPSRIASLIWGHPAGFSIPKVIVVDEDIDYTNMKEVIHAWATKCHPQRGTVVYPHTMTSAAYPYLDKEERRNWVGPSVLYDCTYPYTWPVDERPARTSFQDAYPEEIKEKVLKNWEAYGFR